MGDLSIDDLVDYTSAVATVLYRNMIETNSLLQLLISKRVISEEEFLLCKSACEENYSLAKSLSNLVKVMNDNKSNKESE